METSFHSRLSARLLRCRVLPVPLEDGQPVRLLPLGRLTPAVEPIVGGAPRATQRGDDVGSGEAGKLILEGHPPTVAAQEKSAMPKIQLANSRQCRQIAGMETPVVPELGTRILVNLGRRYTHRRVIQRHGRLVIREQGGFMPLSAFKPVPLGSGATLWKEKSWEEL